MIMEMMMPVSINEQVKNILSGISAGILLDLSQVYVVNILSVIAVANVN